MPIYAFRHGTGAFGPELRRYTQRVDPLRRPPHTLIPMRVELPVVGGAERHGELRRAAPTDAERIPALKLSAAVKRAGKVECEVLREELRVAHDAEWVVDIETAATFILGEELGNHTQELSRLSDYERRALSARRKALRRLDFERVEAERRRVADVAGRHGKPRPGVA